MISIVLSSLLLAPQACGGGNEDADSSQITEVSSDEDVEETSSESSGGIEVDEGSFSTEVRLPLDLFGADPSTMTSAEELQQEMLADGYDVEVGLEDGVAILKMSSSTFDLMKAEMMSGVDQLIAESLAEEGDLYKSVDYSDDMRKFTVEVDGEVFGQTMSFFGFGLVVAAAFYQPFAGVEADDRYVEITYVDSMSGEVLEVFDSRDV